MQRLLVGHARTLTEDEKVVFLSSWQPDSMRGRTEVEPNGYQLDIYSQSICSHVVKSYDWWFRKRKLDFYYYYFILFHIIFGEGRIIYPKPIVVTENSFSWKIKEEGIKFHAGKKTTTYQIYPPHFCFFEDQDFRSC